jgi:hypothetical protein
MAYVFESLDDFLFEELGSLKKFNLPNELLKKIVANSGYHSAGRESQVDLIANPKDYQKLLKDLKADFVAGIISVDGVAKFFFSRESERKFKMHNIDIMRSQEEEKRKRDEERKRRDAERSKQNEGLNEGRSRYRGSYDPSDMGAYSVQTLADFIKGMQGEVTLELIRKDEQRDRKRGERSQIRMKQDPLKQDGNSYSRSSSVSQIRRYEKYASKKRIEIDKKIDSVKEELKEQILNNFDKAMDKILDDLRRGYSWYADPKEIGPAIIKGIDFSKLKNLAAAYDAVEPGGSDPNSIVKATSTLKKLGY